MDSDSSDSEQSKTDKQNMRDSSRPLISYPVQNINGCTSPPPQIQPRTCYRFLFVAFSFWLIMSVTVVILFAYVLRPKLPDFSSQPLSLSNFVASNQSVGARWSAQFHVSNPNKKFSFCYEDVVSLIFHKDSLLTERRIGPFTQGRHNVTTVEVRYSVVDCFVEGKVVDEMNGEMSRGQIKFNVQVSADVA
ncbi:hypothetical protein DITRI_Ditri05aG0061900 [Diplodiscus trichospermus]